MPHRTIAALCLLAGCAPFVDPRIEHAMHVSSPEAQCSGVLISPTEVVTAAHCVHEEMYADGIRVTEVRHPFAAWKDAVVLVLEHAAPNRPAALGGHGELLTLVGAGCSHGARWEARPLIVGMPGHVWGVVCLGDSGGGVYAGDRLVGIVVSKITYSLPDGSEYPGAGVEWLP